jgi:hypothetical protein
MDATEVGHSPLGECAETDEVTALVLVGKKIIQRRQFLKGTRGDLSRIHDPCSYTTLLSKQWRSWIVARGCRCTLQNFEI